MPNEITDVPCTSAEEFLEKLGQKNSIWNEQPNFWVFRGLSDDSHELIPSALRPDAKLGYTYANPAKFGVQPTNRKQIDAEFERIHEFYWSIDKQGLIVPGESDLVRTPAGWKTLEKKTEL